MSKALLKKTFKQMEASELAELLLELYDSRKEAKSYLEYWLNPDPKKELEKVIKSIDRIFFTSQGKSRRAPSLSDLTKIEKDFMSICFDSECVAELLLTVAERQTDWLELRYRRMSYRQSLRKNIDAAALYIESNELEIRFALRLERLRERAIPLTTFHF